MPQHRPAEPDIRRYCTEVFAEADRLHRSPQGRLEARRTRVAAASATYPDLTATVGDARDLPLPDDSVDATLQLGPLYHLPGRADRVTALREAARLTRPGVR